MPAEPWDSTLTWQLDSLTFASPSNSTPRGSGRSSGESLRANVSLLCRFSNAETPASDRCDLRLEVAIDDSDRTDNVSPFRYPCFQVSTDFECSPPCLLD